MAEGYKPFLPTAVQVFLAVEAGLKQAGLPTVHVETRGTDMARFVEPEGDLNARRSAVRSFWEHQFDAASFAHQEGLIAGGTPDHVEQYFTGDVEDAKRQIAAHVVETAQRVAAGDTTALRRPRSVDHL